MSFFIGLIGAIPSKSTKGEKMKLVLKKDEVQLTIDRYELAETKQIVKNFKHIVKPLCQMYEEGKFDAKRVDAKCEDIVS